MPEPSPHEEGCSCEWCIHKPSLDQRRELEEAIARSDKERGWTSSVDLLKEHYI